jgi:hypothetical protein
VLQSPTAGRPGGAHITTSIGILNEGHLHATLRASYVEPGDQLEARVDGYIVDILRDDLIIEVQTANFSAIARKMRNLVERRRVRLVYPIPRVRWIVKMPRTRADKPTRRKSPKHLDVIDVFNELVSFPELIGSPNFELDLVVTEEESLRKFDARRRRRRSGGWITIERRLLAVHDTIALRNSADYASLLPLALPPEFLTSDLAAALRRPRHVAQKMAYCLRNSGLIEKIGARGNAILYTTPATPDRH